MPGVTVLAGGVGGARFARGLLACTPPGEVTIIGNVGDDLEHWGLSISPDLDTLLYTLTGRIHPEQGWGVADDTREAMAVVTELGGSDWFILGDRDIGLHLVRSERLRAGEPLSAVTADFARRFGLGARLLPATDDPLRTRIVTPTGELAFQEWLVGHRAADPVRAVRFEGVPGARPAPGVLEAIESADRIVLAPSNPFVSLDPILAVEGVREAVAARREHVVAITPMIGGAAVKGPLAGHARDARVRRLRGRRRAGAGPAGGRLRARQCRRAARARDRGARPARDLRRHAHARRRERRRRGARRARPAVSDVSVTALRGLPELAPGDDLAGLLIEAAARCAGGLREGDVVCVAQKAISKVEGRSVPLASVQPSARAREIAADEGDPRMIELILGESARIVRRRGAFLVCETRHGFVCAAAGVDRSNAGGGDVADRSCHSIPTPPRAACATRSPRRRRRGDHHRLLRPPLPAGHDRRGGRLRRARARAGAQRRDGRRRARAAGHRAARRRSDRLGRPSSCSGRSAGCRRSSCAA